MKKDKKNKIDLKVVRAINKNVRSSPSIISLVLDQIIGRKVGVVLRDLEFLRKNKPSTEEQPKMSEIKVKKRKKRTYKSVLDV